MTRPEVERLEGLLGSTPIAIGDLILVEVVQGFRQAKVVATARQMFGSLAPLPMLGARLPGRRPRTFSSCAAAGSGCVRRSTGSS
ncbi:MAG: hypothetical protein ACKOZT_13920, partial [Cyanobium sp.]